MLAGSGVAPGELLLVVLGEEGELDGFLGDVLLHVGQQQHPLVLRPDQRLERRGDVVDDERHLQLAGGLVDLDAGDLAHAHVGRVDHAVLGVGAVLGRREAPLAGLELAEGKDRMNAAGIVLVDHHDARGLLVAEEAVGLDRHPVADHGRRGHGILTFRQRLNHPLFVGREFLRRRIPEVIVPPS